MSYGSGNSGNYKKLKGQNIQVLDTDPVVYAGAWATGGAMNTARSELAGAGVQTAAIAFGGEGPPQSASTEEWTDPVLSTKTADTD